jgi:ribosomal protein L12E/L44/L45/RPP1/RPP2
MTDSDSTFGEEGSDSPTESKPNWRRDLEKRAKEAESQLAETQERLSGYERRDVFRSAGLDLEDRQVSYFVKAYDGEMDAEVIRAEAEAAGFVGRDASASSSSPIKRDALDAEQRIAAAGEGGDPVSQADLNSRIAATNTEAELRALMENEGYLWGAAQ